MNNGPSEKKHFFDKPKNIKRFLLGFYIVLGISMIAEFFIHKHAYFSWEEFPFFHAVFGFTAFVSMIITGKYILRPIVKRKEDYYD